MLFDTRGRRKNVIRVVYAVLALLMGASLFLAVGPFNIGELFGPGGSSSSAAGVLDEQAERIEGRLAKDPTNEALLLSLTRIRIAAGNAEVEIDPSTGVQTVPVAAREDFEQGMEAWNRYLKQAGDDPSASAAQLVAITFFKQAESSPSLREAVSSVAKATAAQRIAAEQQPNVGSLSTLAIYEYFNGDFAAGDKAMKQAAARAGSKGEGKSIEKQLAEYRESGKKLEQQKKELAKVQQETGGEQLQTPFPGLGAPPASLAE